MKHNRNRSFNVGISAFVACLMNKENCWFDVALFCCLILISPAQAASFDCAKAQSKVEKLICADAELSKLDEELNAAYKLAVQDEKQGESIRQAQKQWMKERNGCADAVCIKRAYEMRLHGLSKDGKSPNYEKASLPVQAKVEVPIQSHFDESACLAPKIDWRNYQWTLITGNGLPICEEMLSYVKSRPKDVPPPVCPEERLPPNSNWTRPESRILSETEKQVLLSDIPEQWRQKSGGRITYEQQIESTKLLRVLRGDITRDGIPESLLAFNSGDDDYRQRCETSKRCARPEKIFKNGIVLMGDSYNLLPMNDEGTQVGWSHRTVRSAPMLMGGELIYYKGLPYWMTHVSWDQSLHDYFSHTLMRADDSYSKIFGLYGIGHDVVGQHGGAVQPAPFSDVQNLRGDGDGCEFGYFHHNNLKQNPPKRRK